MQINTNSGSNLTFRKVVSLAKNFLGFAVSFLQDVALVPAAGALALCATLGVNFNPKPADIKKHKAAIVLIHGAGFNEAEWLLPRIYLRLFRSKNYGSVFSLNLDGVISNDPTKGIEEYSNKVREFVREVVVPGTACRKVILMGHSLGGLVAADYAETKSNLDQVVVKDVFTFASPLHGTPTIDLVWKFANVRKTKHHEQMSLHSGQLENRNYRLNLIRAAAMSQIMGSRNYYNVWSPNDCLVPFDQGRLTSRDADSQRQYKVNYRGHYYPIYSIFVWQWVCKKLDQIYAEGEGQ
jgi:pimeloyl-ACP methyl ester carboxylesterase